MQVLKTPRKQEAREGFSIPETLNIDTGMRTLLREFNNTLEAPNQPRTASTFVTAVYTATSRPLCVLPRTVADNRRTASQPICGVLFSVHR
jgi:hypothetical protein